MTLAVTMVGIIYILLLYRYCYYSTIPHQSVCFSSDDDKLLRMRLTFTSTSPYILATGIGYGKAVGIIMISKTPIVSNIDS